MKNVFTVFQKPNLLIVVKLAKTNGATFRWKLDGGDDVGELNDGDEFLDEDGGYGSIVENGGRIFGPNDVGFEKIGKP